LTGLKNEGEKGIMQGQDEHVKKIRMPINVSARALETKWAVASDVIGTTG
jgi:hypothetical protein